MVVAIALRDKLAKLEKALRGNLESFELADGRRHYFDPTEAFKATFLFFSACMTADCKGEPRPGPPEILLAVVGARDRSEALFSVMGDSSHLPLDRTALLERGELVNRSLVAGISYEELQQRGGLQDLSE